MKRAMLTYPAVVWFIDPDFGPRDGELTIMSPGKHDVSFTQPQQNVINSTNPCGALDNGIEHWLHICGRAADDAEHLRCSCLVLQRLAQFCVALLKLFEQTDVFDGDNCLVGKSLEECDLLIR